MCENCEKLWLLRAQHYRSTIYFLFWKNNNFLHSHWISENLHVRNRYDIWHTMRLSAMQKYDVWRNKWFYWGASVCWFRSEVRLNLWYQHRKLLSTLANVGSISIWCACHQLDIGSMSTQVVWFIEWNACIPDVDLRSIGYHSA